MKSKNRKRMELKNTLLVALSAAALVGTLVWITMFLRQEKAEKGSALSITIQQEVIKEPQKESPYLQPTEPGFQPVEPGVECAGGC
jgi:hypothetical protein